MNRKHYLTLAEHDKRARESAWPIEASAEVKHAEAVLFAAIDADEPCPDGVPAQWYKAQQDRHLRRERFPDGTYIQH